MDIRQLKWEELRRTRWELRGLERGADVIAAALEQAPAHLWYGNRYFQFTKDDGADGSTTLRIVEQYRIKQVDGAPHVVPGDFSRHGTLASVIGDVSPDELTMINAQHLRHEARAFFDNAAHELDGQEQD